MKKLFCFLFLLIFSSFAFLFFSKNKIDAVKYEYNSGIVEKVHEKVKVNSFDYDYITKFEEGVIYDNGKDIYLDEFYSASSIILNYREYDSWWPFTKDNDVTRIYKYDYKANDFEKDPMASFENEEGKYILSNDGVYKIEYVFEGEIEHISYVNVVNSIHQVTIEEDEKHKETSVFLNFSFNLKLKDAYDLKNNKYYYSFGKNMLDLSFTEFSVFDEEALNSSEEIKEIDKHFTVDVRDSDVSTNGVKKFLFIKIVSSNKGETIAQTSNSFELTNKIQANVYIVDEEGKNIENKISFKRNDKIKFKIVFNDLVSYNNLRYSVDGENFFDLENCTELVDELIIEHTVKGFESFNGDFKLVTKNNVNAVVINKGVNVALNVVSKTDFNVDVTGPNIEVLENGDINGKKEYLIPLSIEEENLKEVLYYVNSCNVVQGDECLDKFDDTNETIVNLHSVLNPVIRIDSELGKFDGKNLALFIKAIDKAGNYSSVVKWGYVVDNVIVSEGEEANVFGYENILVGGETVGKQLVVTVPDYYQVSSVSYNLVGGNKEACLPNIDNLIFKCFKVENYDFNSKVAVELFDLFGNIEEHVVNFKFSTIKVGDVIVNGKNFSLYNDKDYDIEYKTYNSMNGGENLVFDQTVLEFFDRELNFKDIPSLGTVVKRLVYIDGDTRVVIKGNVGNELEVPSVNELLKLLSDVDKFKNCAINKCDVDIYLQYEYSVDNIPQTRLVKINYIDNSNKFVLDNFNAYNELNVGESFEEYKFRYINSLNLNIDASKVVTKRRILFEDNFGNVSEVNSIDTSILGQYVVSETFEYESIGSFPLNYVIKIEDNVSPVIRLKGKDKIYLKIGEVFEDPLAVVSDNYDTNLIVKTKVEPELDVNKVGTYIISYWSEDSSGNVSNVVTRTVVVEKSGDLKVYLISSAVALFTIVTMIIVTIIEVKKEKRRK